MTTADLLIIGFFASYGAISLGLHIGDVLNKFKGEK